jgi:Fur family ferric uptake transcriptional regulator
MAFAKIRKMFEGELEKRGLRKTVERFAILEEIYSRNDHFDVEELYVTLGENKFPVSRATVYNTLDVLLECGLVKKHHFGNSDGALYEKALGFRQHGHLICIDCQLVKEFCDPRLQAIQDNVSNAMGFEITDQALVFYGTCLEADCASKSKLVSEVAKAKSH